MKHRYSTQFEPPAPVASVRLRAPCGGIAAKLTAMIDTGSDLCGVPGDVAADLDLPPVRAVRVVSFSGAQVELIVFRVDVELEAMKFSRVEALVIGRPYVLIGRNLLKQLVIRLDGPQAVFELRRPRR